MPLSLSGRCIRYSRIANEIVKRKENQQLALKPQDLMVLLKLVSKEGAPATYGELAESLGMSASEVPASIGRARAARLVTVENDRPSVARSALKEFLLHGAKYAFPATLGAPTRGVPTPTPRHRSCRRYPSRTSRRPSGQTPKVNSAVSASSPLDPTAPSAAKRDPSLYELLALFDAIRGGAARERQIASQLLSDRLA